MYYLELIMTCIKYCILSLKVYKKIECGGFLISEQYTTETEDAYLKIDISIILNRYLVLLFFDPWQKGGEKYWAIIIGFEVLRCIRILLLPKEGEEFSYFFSNDFICLISIYSCFMQ